MGDGSFKKNFRGKTNDAQGVWLPRTQKHRYAYILDKTLLCNYEPKPYPKKEDFGKKIVHVMMVLSLTKGSKLSILVLTVPKN